MTILWLHRYTPHRHYNHWFHTDFARTISKQENIELKMYGYRMHENLEFRDILLKNYNKKITLKELKKEFDYNVIILDCYNRAYKTTQIKQMWLPKDFSIINIPKIVIEGDYHNIKDPKWYVNLNIDLILHRHLSNVKRAEKDLSIKSLWLPCSIDNNIFKPNSEIERIHNFCAVGEMNNKVYKYRKGALKILINNNLIVREKLIIEEKYITCLQTYIAHLNGSSTFELDIAKMFEIMASGSVLFTNESLKSGLKKLFPDNSYCTYKKDYSDLIIKAKKIINEPNYRKYITTNAMKCITKKHTHEIRAKQLINIIKKEFNL